MNAKISARSGYTLDELSRSCLRHADRLGVMHRDEWNSWWADLKGLKPSSAVGVTENKTKAIDLQAIIVPEKLPLLENGRPWLGSCH